MEIGIVGLPKSGKTTIFNALTRGAAQVDASGGSRADPNVGVVKVPDERLDVLTGIFRPKKTSPAEFTYIDVPIDVPAQQTPGISGLFLNRLQGADALVVVVRDFDDPAVPLVANGLDPGRDAQTMLEELALADLQILERRLARLADGFKGARAPEREILEKERSLLSRLMSDLEDGVAVRDQTFTPDDRRLLEGFQLLTSKPLIVIANVGESPLSDTVILEERLSSVTSGPRVGTAVLSGKLEMELAQMDEADEMEFRGALGAGDSGLGRIVELCHRVLDLVTFFTGNANEVRAWPVPDGTTALVAAGKIHSDLARGFIRGEVISVETLAECGGIPEARKRGVLRREGKGYLVAEGDVINVLFNV